MVAQTDTIRQKIESSVFVKLNAAGRPYEEHYVAHIKVWEPAQDGKGKKSRYVILSRTFLAHFSCWYVELRYVPEASDGSGFIHKAKLNCNGAFSVGKTWKLEELREVEIVNVRPCSRVQMCATCALVCLQSLVFEVTPSTTTYRWQADNVRDQTKFIESLIKLFQAVTGGTVPLRLIGVKLPDVSQCM